MTRIFVTGATGYIGGDFLFAAVKAHPEWNIVCLVRNSEKAEKLVSAFPKLKIVKGDLDSESIIEEEASKANIIYHFANSDHIKSARAISRGLARSRSNPAFWIHTSGSGILTHENFKQDHFGDLLECDKKVYNDWDNINELTSLPDHAIHRHVDKVVLSASEANPSRIRTAIVAPPCIYGVGRGTSNTKSVQVYVAANVALRNGRAVHVGSGTNIWHEVHIQDLSNLFVLLGEAAAQGGGRATWNEKGYYLAENGSFVWGEVIQEIGSEGWRQRLLSSKKVESIDTQKGFRLHKNFPYLCGTTSRGVSIRARRLLGWKATQAKMASHIHEILQVEAKELGLSKLPSNSRL